MMKAYRTSSLLDRSSVILFAVLLIGSNPTYGQNVAVAGAASLTKTQDVAKKFVASEAMIPMRDGVKLHAKIFDRKARKATCRSSSSVRPTTSPMPTVTSTLI